MYERLGIGRRLNLGKGYIVINDTVFKYVNMCEHFHNKYIKGKGLNGKVNVCFERQSHCIHTLIWYKYLHEIINSLVTLCKRHI